MKSMSTGSPAAWQYSTKARCRAAARRRRAARGFSVLEVLVALVILALVGTALFSLFSGALTNVSAAEDYSRAVLVADSVLTEAAGTTPLREGTKSGTTEDGRIDWTASVKAYQPPASPNANAADTAGSVPMTLKLWQIEAEVRFAGPNGKERSLKLTTLRLGPQQDTL